MPFRKSSLKTLSIVSGAIFLIVVLLYLFRGSILTGLGNFLVVNDTLEPADIIVVLLGGESTRPFHTAELYDKGFAKNIVVPQVELTPAVQLGIYPSQTQATLYILEEQGIPDSVIQIADFPQGVSSTLDEARALNAYIKQYSIKSVIIVTDAFHTRRARYIFKKELQEESIKIMISPAPHWKFDATNWWKHEEGFVSFINEYLKFIHYLLL